MSHHALPFCCSRDSRSLRQWLLPHPRKVLWSRVSADLHWTCSMEKKYTIGVSSHWNLWAACSCSITQPILTEAVCKGQRILRAWDQSLPRQQCYAGRPGVAQTGFHGDRDPGGVTTLRYVVVTFAGWTAHLVVYPDPAF